MSTMPTLQTIEALSILAHTRRHGGCTYDLQRQEVVDRSTGYAVALAAPASARAYIIGFDVAEGLFTGADVDHIVNQIRTVLNEARQGGLKYVGTWVDDGVLHVEPAIVVNLLDEAITIAVANHQRAIYDFERGEAVSIPQSTVNVNFVPNPCNALGADYGADEEVPTNA